MAVLSKRGARNVGMYMSHLPISLVEVIDDSNWIDLSFAENYTIRKELLEINAQAAKNATVTKDLNWPHGFYGEARLLTALSSLFNTYFSPVRPVQNKDVVLTTGAAGALNALAWGACDAGDGVLIPCPYHAGAYEVFLHIQTDIVPIPVSVKNLDEVFGDGLIPRLEQAVKEASVPVKALVIANPHNPLGRCYSRENLVQLMQFCQRHALHFISDELFALSEHTCSDLRRPRKFRSALSIDTAAIGVDPDRVHVIWSMSKDLGATGTRLACVVTSSKDMRDSIGLASHTQISNMSIVFSRELLTSPKLHELVQLNAARLSAGYQRMTAFFKAEGIEYFPCDATTFVLARLAPYAHDREAEQAAVDYYQKEGVLFFAAAGYRMPTDFTRGWMRCSFAVEPERMTIALERISVAFRKYMIDHATG